MKYIRIIVLLIAVGLTVATLLSGCAPVRHDERLTEVAREISDSLEKAQALLKSIDKKGLTKDDRHYFDFLSLKIDDKNYVRHTSDSLYLTIKGYYDRHSEDELYPEVLYYGGRVYSDMGDYPTALKYFQDALDALPEDTKDLDLKSRLLSQTGRLLNQLHLYTEAEKYIKEVVEISRTRGDYEGLMYDLQLLGSINMNLQNLTLARTYYLEAYEIGRTLSSTHEARAKMYLAGVEKQLGNLSSALSLIRGVPESVKPIIRNQANAYACDIYYTAGKLDSAYYYCRKLIDHPDASNRKTAFSTLLSPKMIHFIPADSLSWYLQVYNECMMDYVNKNNGSQVEYQISIFNYNAKQQAIERMKEKNNEIVMFSLSTIILILLLSIILIIMMGREKIRKLRHQSAQEKIMNLQESLEFERGYRKDIRILTEKEEMNSSKTQGREEVTAPHTEHSRLVQEDKRSVYRKELLNAVSLGESPLISSQILESKVYTALNNYIKAGKVVPEKSKIWKELETLVLEVSPNFSNSITLLMNGKQTENDFRTCLLMKIGLGPSEMCKILGISPGAVVSRRESVSRRIYDEAIGAKVIDKIIRLI